MSPTRRSYSQSRAVMTAVLAGGVGLSAAYAGASLVDVLGGARALQQVVAFGLIAATLVAFAARQRQSKDADPTALLSTLIAIAVAVVAALNVVGPIDPKPERGCVLTEGAVEGTVTADKSPLYARPSVTAPVRGLLLVGCQVRAEGYCYAERHPDALNAELSDTRWLRLGGEGSYLPAGHLVGDIPRDKSVDCRGGRKASDAKVIRVSAKVDLARGRVSIGAQTQHAAMVGFAARRSDGRWVRLGADFDPSDNQPAVLPFPTDLQKGELRAIACAADRWPEGRSVRIKAQRESVTTKAAPVKVDIAPTSKKFGDAACTTPGSRAAS